MAVDDENGDLYVAEEEIGIWKYGAEPTAGTGRTQVDTTDGGGNLTADVEGLAIYYAADGKGYLLCSSQGSDDYTVYTRDGGNEYLGRFDIGSGVVDGVTDSDGIDVQSFVLGDAFPQGVFITQDGSNSGRQNFKLVPWERIAATDPGDIKVDTSQNPRGAIWLDDKRQLRVTGTRGDDDISIQRVEEDDQIVIRIDDRAPERFSRKGIKRILASGLEGDDRIVVKKGPLSMRIPVRFDGGRGDDTLAGGNGADRLLGGGGHDKLYGRAGDDSLAGGSGNDRLAGEQGADTLIGGAGIDRFILDDEDDRDEDPQDLLG
jgi:3-phytase